MRNLKRALSLALASVMLLGMMVVGSSAKGLDDFSDNAEIVNKDAVAVTSAIGLFDGYEDGSFGPENVVTRAEMAVIICTMLYGAGVNVNQFAETSVFTDVPAWAQGYVNLCSSLGIVAGVGDGKFRPDGTLSRQEAAVMVARAAGLCGLDTALDAAAVRSLLASFSDYVTTAAWARESLAFCYQENILDPSDLAIRPAEAIRRCEVARMLFRMLDRAELLV